MSEKMNDMFLRLEFVNEFGDRTLVEFEGDQGQQTETAWMVQNFRQFMLACGFQPDIVKDFLGEE